MKKKDLYNGNFKSLKKIVQGEAEDAKDSPFSKVGKINFVRMTFLSKAMYRYDAIPMNTL